LSHETLPENYNYLSLTPVITLGEFVASVVAKNYTQDAFSELFEFFYFEASKHFASEKRWTERKRMHLFSTKTTRRKSPKSGMKSPFVLQVGRTFTAVLTFQIIVDPTDLSKE
jgi:hypothetical protein